MTKKQIIEGLRSFINNFPAEAKQSRGCIFYLMGYYFLEEEEPELFNEFQQLLK